MSTIEPYYSLESDWIVLEAHGPVTQGPCSRTVYSPRFEEVSDLELLALMQTQRGRLRLARQATVLSSRVHSTSAGLSRLVDSGWYDVAVSGSQTLPRLRPQRFRAAKMGPWCKLPDSALVSPGSWRDFMRSNSRELSYGLSIPRKSEYVEFFASGGMPWEVR